MFNFKNYCLLLSILFVTACGVIPERNASIKSESLSPLNEEGLRLWDENIIEAETYDILVELSLMVENKSQGDEVNYLALSGGGVNGAFSAGILNAWTELGTRPDFDVVTGVSTGAIVSIYAYLGSEYDEDLKHYYRDVALDEMFERNSILTFFSKRTLLNTTKFEQKVRSAIDDDIMSKLAIERSKGRMLIIGTTNLDNGKMALWDVGKIAQIGSEQAKSLIQGIIIASSSVPGAFPAQLISLSSEGQSYDELHVDGGISRQVFLIPQWLNQVDQTELPQHVYVIRNGSLKPRYKVVSNDFYSISARSIEMLVRNQGIGDVEYIYHLAKQRKVSFNLAHIDDDFDLDDYDTFELEYMRAVYDYGHDKVLKDQTWLTTPPSLIRQDVGEAK